MNIAEASKRIKKISHEIEEHNYCYYALHQPVISDKEYDDLLAELVSLENQFPDIKEPDSPSQRIGVKLSASAHAVKHALKMCSLDNTYSIDELKQWHQRVAKGLAQERVEFVAELKIDGVSTALTYANGRFVLGATRGDGIAGEDVTHSLRTIRSIPLRIKAAENIPEELEVRGEVYMNLEDFRCLNLKRKKAGEDLFANPRNAAAGSIKLLDSRVTAQRRLSCFVHSFGALKGGRMFRTQWEFLNGMRAFGFSVDTSHRLCSSMEGVIDYCREYQQKRESIPYAVDGVVIKVNSIQQQSQLGNTLKSPRWAVAYKFPAYQATTVVKSITVQVGRTGVLTPVANLEPVECAGVMISRSTLHNFDEIKRLGVQRGDRVLVERAGDVIPKIVKVVSRAQKRRENISLVPRRCPQCGGPIKKEKSEEVAYCCVNPKCVGKLERGLLHFASRGAMDIEGFGEAVVAQLIEKGFVGDLADIYAIGKEDLLTLDLFKERKADKLMLAIERSKNLPLSRFLFGLGIPNIGEKAASLLAGHFGSIDQLMGAERQELEAIHEFGAVMARAVFEYFHDPVHKGLISRFRKAGVTMSEPVSRRKSSLAGKKFVFTGELQRITRSQAAAAVKQLGGDVISSVSQKTDFVVAGQSPGSKYNKAVGLGMTILNEEQFHALLIQNSGGEPELEGL